MYNVAGPQGPEKFEGGVAGYEARAFRGCGIFTSTPFEVSDDSESLQMLQRTTQLRVPQALHYIPTALPQGPMR